MPHDRRPLFPARSCAGRRALPAAIRPRSPRAHDRRPRSASAGSVPARSKRMPMTAGIVAMSAASTDQSGNAIHDQLAARGRRDSSHAIARWMPSRSEAAVNSRRECRLFNAAIAGLSGRGIGIPSRRRARHVDPTPAGGRVTTAGRRARRRPRREWRRGRRAAARPRALTADRRQPGRLQEAERRKGEALRAALDQHVDQDRRGDSREREQRRRIQPEHRAYSPRRAAGNFAARAPAACR